MKKKIAMLLAAVMMFSMTSCSGGGTTSSTAPAPSSDGGASAPAESSEPANPDAGAVLKVWIPPYAGGDAEYNDMDFWTDQFKDFETENDCKVEVSIFPWSGYMQKITTGLNSGDGPDVIYIDTLYDLAAAGALLPLGSYFTEEEKANYYYYDMGMIAGDQYVLPLVVGDATVMFCNMDILKEAGFTTPPKTWDEIVTYSKKIKEVKPDIYSLIQPWGNSSGKSTMMTSFLPYFWQAGGEFLTADGKPNLDSDAGRTTLNYLKGFQDEGIFDDTIVSVGDAPAQFRSGQAAMFMGGTGMAASFTEAGINWDFGKIEGPGGKGYWISGDSLAVVNSTKHKELSVKAMKHMASAKVMDQFHEKLYAAAPLTKDSKYTEDERFQEIYEKETEFFHVWPAFNNADSFYDILFKNIQSMYMGDLTTEQVIENTMKEYNSAAS